MNDNKILQMKKRITPKFVFSLSENEIFVFGSNLSGRHGAGAARTAMHWGAKYGQGIGLQGNTYAIPTKNASVTKALAISEIALHVNEFIAFAKANQQYIFLVTEVGCGLAGHSPKDIAPLFKDSVAFENIFLPENFWKIIL